MLRTNIGRFKRGKDDIRMSNHVVQKHVGKQAWPETSSERFLMSKWITTAKRSVLRHLSMPSSCGDQETADVKY
jgi:hypothetical protein